MKRLALPNSGPNAKVRLALATKLRSSISTSRTRRHPQTFARDTQPRSFSKYHDLAGAARLFQLHPTASILFAASWAIERARLRCSFTSPWVSLSFAPASTNAQIADYSRCELCCGGCGIFLVSGTKVPWAVRSRWPGSPCLAAWGPVPMEVVMGMVMASSSRTSRKERNILCKVCAGYWHC